MLLPSGLALGNIAVASQPPPHVNLERYRHELEAVLQAQSELAYRRAAGLAESDRPTGELSDRLDDLTGDSTVRDLRLLGEGEAEIGPLLACVEHLATACRTREPFDQLRRRLSSEGLVSGGQLVPLELAEVWLAGEHRRSELEPARVELEAASSVRAECIEELAAARAASGPAGAGTGAGEAEADGAAESGRGPTHAATLIEASTGPMRQLLDALLPRTIPRHGPVPAWTALPFFLGGEPLATGVAEPGDRLIDYVTGSLGIDRAVLDRLEIDAVERPAKLPGEHVHAIRAGGDVRVSWRPMGRLRDYRGLLRSLGAGLPLALVEDRDALDMRLAGEGVARVWASLFGHLTLEPDWLHATFPKPPSAGVRTHWAAQHLIHARQAAATRLSQPIPGGARMPPVPDPDLMTEATGFVHPDVPVPWASSREGASLDLQAESVAAGVREVLATRFGSDWWRRPECGRLLRDLWAAGHLGADELCSDLGARPLLPDDLVQEWLLVA